MGKLADLSSEYFKNTPPEQLEKDWEYLEQLDMNENLNLCEILKGHEGETFYSDVFGLVTLVKVTDLISIHWMNDSLINLYPNGSKINGERCIIFPSKDQRDWNKWIEEQKPKTPKIWNEIVNKKDYFIEYKDTTRNNFDYEVVEPSPIEKSALALLKIHQLIKVGYGGNVNNYEWKDREITKYFISFDADGDFGIEETILSEEFSHLAFHTTKQAEEFLSYPENVQLLKDYFMI